MKRFQIFLCRALGLKWLVMQRFANYFKRTSNVEEKLLSYSISCALRFVSFFMSKLRIRTQNLNRIGLTGAIKGDIVNYFSELSLSQKLLLALKMQVTEVWNVPKSKLASTIFQFSLGTAGLNWQQTSLLMHVAGFGFDHNLTNFFLHFSLFQR